jgi:hypothetical protein
MTLLPYKNSSLLFERCRKNAERQKYHQDLENAGSGKPETTTGSLP